MLRASASFVSLALAVQLSLAPACSLSRAPLTPDGCGPTGPCPGGARCEFGVCVGSGFDGGAGDAESDVDVLVSLDGPGTEDSAERDTLPTADTPPGVDAGDTCADGLLSTSESDVDCGGICAPCTACLACRVSTDCAGGAACTAGLCAPALTTTTLRDGTNIPAYVRADGATLLAHYGPGTFNPGYNPFVSQIVTSGGGGPAPPGFAPDPCVVSGHLDFDRFDPAGRIVEMQCGTGISSIWETVASSALFDTFANGDRGTAGAAGVPGWANLAGVGSGLGRSRYAGCGTTPTFEAGGIAYCSGPFAPDFANHLVSYTVGSGRVYVGCGGAGCSGGSCDLHVWVWVHP